MCDNNRTKGGATAQYDLPHVIGRGGPEHGRDRHGCRDPLGHGLSAMVYRPWSLEGRRVDVMPVSEPVPTMDVGFAWPIGAELNEAARAFVEFLHLAVGVEQQ